jgi:hypothetical protein
MSIDQDNRLQTLQYAIAKARKGMGQLPLHTPDPMITAVTVASGPPPDDVQTPKEDKKWSLKQEVKESAVEALAEGGLEFAVRGAGCAVRAMQPAYRTGGSIGPEKFSSAALETAQQSFETGCETAADALATRGAEATIGAMDSVLQTAGSVASGALDIIGTVVGSVADGL